MAELWWANAFVGIEAAGNATGVVVLEEPKASESYAAIARQVRAPDTVFLTRRANGEWDARFYSPFEGEMAFCGQALIAADAVLRARGDVSIGDVTLLTRSGRVTVGRDETRPHVTWLHVNADDVREVQPVRLLRAIAELPGSGPERVIDSGRKRVYRELPSVAALDAVRIAPEQVLSFCHAESISGIVLYADAAPGLVALRVFTVSLEGGEDASTGGAALAFGVLFDLAERGIELRQGVGHPLRRGHLFVRRDRARGTIAVGGEVQLVARGQLIVHP